jgi:hypothetical protein
LGAIWVRPECGLVVGEAQLVAGPGPLDDLPVQLASDLHAEVGELVQTLQTPLGARGPEVAGRRFGGGCGAVSHARDFT